MSQIIREALNYLKERFGIPEDIFRDYALMYHGDIWITTTEAAKLSLKTWRRKGIRLVRVFNKGFKFTTTGMQMFAKYANKNIIELQNAEEALNFLRGQDIKVTETDAEEGQVIVKFGKDILGSGLYRHGKIKNQIPKGRRIS